MTDTAQQDVEHVRIIGVRELPAPKLKRNIWQPVTGHDGVKMRLAPLDWQPSGAHHALEYLAGENEQLRAHAAIVAMPSPVVKPLVWDGTVVSSNAETPFGDYLVEKDKDYGWGFWHPDQDIDDDDPFFGYHPTEQSAKDAAQADYIRRINSALTTPTPDGAALSARAAELEAALSDAVDALELANSLLSQNPITYAIPLTNQFNARHAAAERARALITKEARHEL